jgi:hypothetical protein
MKIELCTLTCSVYHAVVPPSSSSCLRHKQGLLRGSLSFAKIKTCPLPLFICRGSTHSRKDASLIRSYRSHHDLSGLLPQRRRSGRSDPILRFDLPGHCRDKCPLRILRLQLPMRASQRHNRQVSNSLYCLSMRCRRCCQYVNPPFSQQP